MKVFVQSQNGEDGPFSPPELRQLFEAGKLRSDQFCRVDGAAEMKPISQQFPELTAEQIDWEEEGREKRRAERQRKRIRNMTGGVLLFVVGIALLFFVRPGKGIIVAVSGFILFVNGCLQSPSGRRPVREGRNRWDDSRRQDAERTAPRTNDY